MKDLREPKPPTLRKYGLSLDEWRAMAERQGFVCYVCEKEPSTGRLVIDHFHAKGWKKMPPQERKKYVRGLLCWFCNHAYVGRGITVAKARRVVEYLEAFAAATAPPSASSGR